MEVSGIIIPFRPDGAGKGALFDHYVLQRITGKHTCVLAADEQAATKAAQTIRAYIREITFKPPHWQQHQGDLIIPTVTLSQFTAGGRLLIVPGKARPRSAAEEQTFAETSALYRAAIRAASTVGMPVLALCAGSWDLWAHFGGVSSPVTDHCYNGGMIRLNDSGAVRHNVQVHCISFQDPAKAAEGVASGAAPVGVVGVLAGVWARVPGGPPADIAVNSVHWLAIDDQQGGEWRRHAEVVAWSVGWSTTRPNGVLHTRTGELMRPQEGSPEAFEQRYGAPMLGLQWHAEAYIDETDAVMKAGHCGTILEVVRAGDAFAARRQLVTAEALLAARATMCFRAACSRKVRAWLRERITSIYECKRHAAARYTSWQFLQLLVYLKATAGVPTSALIGAVRGLPGGSRSNMHRLVKLAEASVRSGQQPVMCSDQNHCKLFERLQEVYQQQFVEWRKQIQIGSTPQQAHPPQRRVAQRQLQPWRLQQRRQCVAVRIQVQAPAPPVLQHLYRQYR